jgi:hypothetical protein
VPTGAAQLRRGAACRNPSACPPPRLHPACWCGCRAVVRCGLSGRRFVAGRASPSAVPTPGRVKSNPTPAGNPLALAAPALRLPPAGSASQGQHRPGAALRAAPLMGAFGASKTLTLGPPPPNPTPQGAPPGGHLSPRPAGWGQCGGGFSLRSTLPPAAYPLAGWRKARVARPPPAWRLLGGRRVGPSATAVGRDRWAAPTSEKVTRSCWCCAFAT